MEEEKNKRKIKKATTLQGRHIHKKHVEVVNIEKNTMEKEEIKKDTKNEENKSSMAVGQFQLVVIKIPWYKKLIRSFMGFLGFGYY